MVASLCTALIVLEMARAPQRQSCRQQCCSHQWWLLIALLVTLGALLVAPCPFHIISPAKATRSLRHRARTRGTLSRGHLALPYHKPVQWFIHWQPWNSRAPRRISVFVSPQKRDVLSPNRHPYVRTALPRVQPYHAS